MNALAPLSDGSIERLLFLHFSITFLASDAGSGFKTKIQEAVEVETSPLAGQIGVVSRRY